MKNDGQRVHGSAAVTHFTYCCKLGQELTEKLLRKHGNKLIGNFLLELSPKKVRI